MSRRLSVGPLLTDPMEKSDRGPDSSGGGGSRLARMYNAEGTQQSDGEVDADDVEMMRQRDIARILTDLNPVCKLLYGKDRLGVGPFGRLGIRHPSTISQVSAGTPFWDAEAPQKGSNPEFRISDYTTTKRSKIQGARYTQQSVANDASRQQIRLKRRDRRKADKKLKQKLFDQIDESYRRRLFVKCGGSDPYHNREDVVTSPLGSLRDLRGSLRKKVEVAMGALAMPQQPAVKHEVNPLGDNILFAQKKDQNAEQNSVSAASFGAHPLPELTTSFEFTPTNLMSAEPSERPWVLSPQSLEATMLPPLVSVPSAKQLKRPSSFFATQQADITLNSIGEDGAQLSGVLSPGPDSPTRAKRRDSMLRTSSVLFNKQQSSLSRFPSIHKQPNSSFADGATDDIANLDSDDQSESRMNKNAQDLKRHQLFLEFPDVSAAYVLSRKYKREDNTTRRHRIDEETHSTITSHLRFLQTTEDESAGAYTKISAKIDRCNVERKMKYWKRFALMDLAKPLPARVTPREIVKTVQSATGETYDSQRVEEFKQEVKQFSRLQTYCAQSYVHPLVPTLLDTAKGFLAVERAPRPEQFVTKIVPKLLPTETIFNDVVSTAVHVGKMCAVSKADVIDHIRGKARNYVVDRVETDLEQVLIAPSPSPVQTLSISHNSAPNYGGGGTTIVK